jgi:amidohydrolase
LDIDPIVVSTQIITTQTIVSRNITLTDITAVVTRGLSMVEIEATSYQEQVEMLGTIRTFTNEDEGFVKE